jgi:hypothetical protein
MQSYRVEQWGGEGQGGDSISEWVSLPFRKQEQNQKEGNHNMRAIREEEGRR